MTVSRYVLAMVLLVAAANAVCAAGRLRISSLYPSPDGRYVALEETQSSPLKDDDTYMIINASGARSGYYSRLVQESVIGHCPSYSAVKERL
jgi:hypothetical protein